MKYYIAKETKQRIFAVLDAQLHARAPNSGKTASNLADVKTITKK